MAHTETLQFGSGIMQMPARTFDHDFTDSVVYAALYLKHNINRPRVIVMKDGSRMEKRFFKYYRNAITGRKNASKSSRDAATRRFNSSIISVILLTPTMVFVKSEVYQM